MSDNDVRIADPSEQDAALDVLMLAFSADPCMRFAFSKPQAFVAAFRTLALAMGGAAFEHGGAYLAEDGSAAALWLPPGVQGAPDMIESLVERLVEPEKHEVLGKLGEAMAEHHPHEPHGYLPMIGVDPSRQGRGLGSTLLKAGLERCDAEGAIAYLESSNPANIPLYERHGFEVVGLIKPGDFPGLYPMLRPPRR